MPLGKFILRARTRAREGVNFPSAHSSSFVNKSSLTATLGFCLSFCMALGIFWKKLIHE